MTDWPLEAFELCKGPQDGAAVQQIGPVMPETIYVPSQDGWARKFVAWSTEKSNGFPFRYVMDAYKFVFSGDPT